MQAHYHSLNCPQTKWSSFQASHISFVWYDKPGKCSDWWRGAALLSAEMRLIAPTYSQLFLVVHVLVVCSFFSCCFLIIFNITNVAFLLSVDLFWKKLILDDHIPVEYYDLWLQWPYFQIPLKYKMAFQSNANCPLGHRCEHAQVHTTENITFLEPRRRVVIYLWTCTTL